MDREKPPYLDDVPRDRSGNWPLYLLAVALLAALIGGWKIYAGTVAAWSDRFENPAPSANQQINAQVIAERQLAADRMRQQSEAARAEARLRRIQQLQSGELRCINGTLFRKLPGGWENVPGERC